MYETEYQPQVSLYDVNMIGFKYSLLATIGDNQEVVFKDINITVPYMIIISAPYDIDGDGLPDNEAPYELTRYEYQPDANTIYYNISNCKDLESIGKGENYSGASHQSAWH